MKVTAESITDEQIRELMEEVRDIYEDTIAALGDPLVEGDCAPRPDLRQSARARCAEILNARAKENS